MTFWSRFYIVILGMTFFSLSNLLSISYLDFYIPFLFGLLFSLSCLDFYFPFSIWTFIFPFLFGLSFSLFYLDFYFFFRFLFILFYFTFVFLFFQIAIWFWISSKFLLSKYFAFIDNKIFNSYLIGLKILWILPLVSLARVSLYCFKFSKLLPDWFCNLFMCL